MIAARYARAYIDVNREPFELDAAMFEDELPEFARPRTARVAAGLGAIARVVAEGQEIYARKLTFAEARGRIDGAHRPYHAALERLLAERQRRFGFAILIDWHSMPAAAAGRRARPAATSCWATASARPARGADGGWSGSSRPGLPRGAQHSLCGRLHHRALRPPAAADPRPADRDQPRPLS